MKISARAGKFAAFRGGALWFAIRPEGGSANHGTLPLNWIMDGRAEQCQEMLLMGGWPV